jgi:hypothetical protein
MTCGPPPLARRRAEAELIRDPARSDALIACAARCTGQAVWRWRRDLVEAGVIEHVPADRRAARVRSWPPTMSRKAIESGATTAAEIMALCPGVSYGAAWAALSRARQAVTLVTIPADAAAATETLRVVITPAGPFTRPSRRKPPQQLPAGYYAPRSSIESACPGCTLVWRDGAFTHEPSCPLRSVPVRRS